MDQKNNSQQVVIKKRGRLSTEMINLGKLSPQKLQNDLVLLRTATKEKKIDSTNIQMNTDESTQEMLALKLSNPFRGY